MLALDPSQTLDQIVRDQWGAGDLPQMSIETMHQTSDGYLWLGTQEGLVRFDGVRFRVFNSKDGPEFADTFITALHEDRQGRLWFGTWTGQVNRIENGVPTQVIDFPGDHTVNVIYGDRLGRTWIGTRMGLFCLVDDKLVNAPGLAKTRGVRVTSILEDRGGTLWVGTHGLGLLRVNKNEDISLTRLEGLPGDRVACMVEDRSGTIWLGISGHGLVTIKNGSIEKVELDGTPDVLSLLWDKDQSLWIGTPGEGLLRYQEGEIERFSEKHDLAEGSVLTLFEDGEGHLWVGLMGKGLYRLGDARFGVFGKPEGLMDEMVWVTYEDRDGRLWFGMHLDLMVLEDGQLVDYGEKLGVKEGVTSVFQDSRGDHWVGTWEGRVVRYRNGAVKSFQLRDEQVGLLSIIETKDGAIWAGHEGVSRFDGKNWTHHFPEQESPRRVVSTILEDREGVIWVGMSTGVYRQDGDNWIAMADQFEPMSRYVHHLFEDSSGSIWITADKVLMRYRSGELEVFTEADGLASVNHFMIVEDDSRHLWFSSNQGVHRIALDAFDTYALNGSDALEFQTFGTPDGMRSAECNFQGSSSGFLGRDGRIWFPTVSGAVFVDPASLKFNLTPPRVNLARAVVGAEATPIQDGAVLKAGSRNFRFDYTAFYYHAPEQLHFKYKLENMDGDWIDAGSRRFANYSDLNPGDYRFHIIAANSDGAWNRQGASISFRLEPFFYQTWPFYLAVVAVVLMLAFAFHSWRIQRHRKREERLQQIVLDRTHELAVTNEELVMANRSLAESARQAGMAEIATEVLHNIGNTMNSANTSANMMEKLLREDLNSRVVHRLKELVLEHETDLGSWFDDDVQGQRTPGSLLQMCAILSESQAAMGEELEIFASQIRHIEEIVHSQARVGETIREDSIFEIGAVVEDVVKMQAHLTRGVLVDLARHLNKPVLVCASKSDFLQVTNNLIKNAVEAIQANLLGTDHKLTIDMRLQGNDRVVVSFKDTGCGIDSDNLRTIFEHGYTTKPTGHGFGLHYCQKVVQDMGGRLLAHSDGLGQGATFKLELPVFTPDGEAHR